MDLEKTFADFKFTPYRSYMGYLDELLGVDMFWYEKIIIFILYLERVALITMFHVPWPFFFLENSKYLFVFLLDFSAHHGSVPALGNGSIFEGCEVGCKVLWTVFVLTALIIWALGAAWDTFSMYHSVNLERVLWGFLQICFLPFANVIVRYFMVDAGGELDTGDATWSTPLSELGTFFLILLVCTVGGIGYARASRQILFTSNLRHESYLRSRELEYLLQFSPTYRNERVWMVSHYNLNTWWWSLSRMAVDLALLLALALADPQTGITLACVFLGLVVIAMIFVVSVHRCWSSNWLELVANLALFVYSLLGVLQAFGVRNALLVDNVLAWIVLGIHVGSIGLCLLLCVYFFIDGHTFKWYDSIADKRAADKWQRYFSPEALQKQEKQRLLAIAGPSGASSRRRRMKEDGGEEVGDFFDDDDDENDSKAGGGGGGGGGDGNVSNSNSQQNQQFDYDDGDDAHGDEEEFVAELRRLDARKAAETMKARQEAEARHEEIALTSAEEDQRRQANALKDRIIDIDSSSPHTWPTNMSIVNELMRRNATDHLVDYLRAARKLLDRISLLHNSPMLVPTDEIKMHINRLEKGIQHCKLERITHHANLIHPLQPTFEELIEHLTYELRIFRAKSVTKGHNARKMIEVSRFLRMRMDKREVSLALLSPQMRRILLKMFALRVFIQLIFDKEEKLFPKKYNPAAAAMAKAQANRRKKKRRGGGGGDQNNSDDDDDDDDDSVDIAARLHQFEDPFAADNDAFGQGEDAVGAFHRDDDDDLNDNDDEQQQAQLAEMLRERKHRAAGGGGGGGGPGGPPSAENDMYSPRDGNGDYYGGGESGGGEDKKNR